MDSLASVFDAKTFKLRNDGLRFDLATEDLSKSYFFSYENFGFQMEAASDFDIFKKECEFFFSRLKDNAFYTWSDGLIRIGTKSEIFYHKSGETLEKTKEIFTNKLLSNKAEIELATRNIIIDSAYHFDFEVQSGVANVLMGPVSKDEALKKFFAEKVKIYERKFENNCALAFIIDLANKEKVDINSWSTLEDRVKKQISDLEILYDGLKTYMYK
jgi:hypothetical protein